MRTAATRLQLGILLMLLFAAGCSTGSNGFPRIINEPAPLPSSELARFGKIGLLPVAGATNLHLGQPFMPADVARRMSQQSYRDIQDLLYHDEDEEKTEPVRIPFTALFAAGGDAVAALLPGVRKEDFLLGRERLRLALARHSIEGGLQQQFGAGRQPRSNLKLLSVPALAKVHPRNFRLDFSGLSDEGIRSVMDIRVSDFAFEADPGRNPAMSVAVQVTVYIFRVSDGSVLHANYFDYRGEKKHFSEWGKDAAIPFLTELALAEKSLVETILETYFPAPPPKTATWIPPFHFLHGCLTAPPCLSGELNFFQLSTPQCQRLSSPCC